MRKQMRNIRICKWIKNASRDRRYIWCHTDAHMSGRKKDPLQTREDPK